MSCFSICLLIGMFEAMSNWWKKSHREGKKKTRQKERRHVTNRAAVREFAAAKQVTALTV